MMPLFRQDLTASREEQQGVVFYRIDDPKTQTSFRLYEIEYLIAMSLNGGRDLEQVIATVKQEYNFDISKPDLQKFVSQLESMGFIEGDTTDATTQPGLSSHGEITTEESPIGEHNFDLEGSPEPIAIQTDELITDTLGQQEVTAPDFDMVDSEPGVQGLASSKSASSEDALEEEPTHIINRPQRTDTAPEPRALYDEVTEQANQPQLMGAPRGTEPRRDEQLSNTLRTAAQQLQQGLAANALDYFTAAKQLQPSDERIQQMVAALEAAGEKPDTPRLHELWERAREYFPELVTEVGEWPAFDEGQSTGAESEDDLKSRVFWTSILVAVLIVGIGGLIWMARAANLFEDVAEVQVRVLEPGRVPVFFPGVAVSVQPVQEKVLTATASGVIAEAQDSGSRLSEGEVVVAFKLKAKLQRKLDKARRDIENAKTVGKKADAQIARIKEERTTLEAKRDEVRTKLKELKPTDVHNRGGVSKGEVAKLRKQIVRANRKLTALAKKERRPAAQKRKSETRLKSARRIVRELQAKSKGKIVFMPFSGEVLEVRAAVGTKVKKGSTLATVRDGSSVRLNFELPGDTTLQRGGELSVITSRDRTVTGKIERLEKRDDVLHAVIVVPDSDGSLIQISAADFRLVREFAEPAYLVASQAVMESEQGASIYLAVRGRVEKRLVEVVSRSNDESIIKARGGGLNSGDRVIVSVGNQQGMAGISEDVAIEVASD